MLCNSGKVCYDFPVFVTRSAGNPLCAFKHFHNDAASAVLATLRKWFEHYMLFIPLLLSLSNVVFGFVVLFFHFIDRYLYTYFVFCELCCRMCLIFSVLFSFLNFLIRDFLHFLLELCVFISCSWEFLCRLKFMELHMFVVYHCLMF